MLRSLTCLMSTFVSGSEKGFCCHNNVKFREESMRQKMSRLLSCSVMTLAFMPMAWAQPQSDVRNPTELTDHIDGTQAIIESQQLQLFADPRAGMIINRTVTVQGHDFFRFFSTIW